MSDITPEPHFLESIRADVGSYWQLLAEGVDNSFDAGATEIRLTLEKDVVAFKDDGIGITKDRQLSLVRLGEHRAMATTNLGRFGIGIKYQAVSAGDLLDVLSISCDGRMTLHANWADVIRLGRWEIDDPRWINKNGTTGTTITIRRLRWRSPQPKDVRTSVDKLAQYFYPALVGNRKIFLNNERIPLLREPDLTDLVEGEVMLRNGKGAHVRAGVIKHVSSASPLYQIQVSYKHRVIKPQSIFGCDGFSGLRGMFGRVDLIGPWTLARFKDDLADNDADELEEAVLEIMRPVLEKCHSAHMSAQVEGMTALLNDMLPPELVAARPTKAKKESSAETTKEHRGTQHGRTNNPVPNVDGPARTPKNRNRLLIEFDQPIAEEYGYGHFIKGKPSKIVLAADNPHIAALLAIRDQAMGAQSLYAIAMMLYAQAQPPEQGELFEEPSAPFGLRVWQLTKRQSLDETAIA